MLGVLGCRGVRKSPETGWKTAQSYCPANVVQEEREERENEFGMDCVCFDLSNTWLRFFANKIMLFRLTMVNFNHGNEFD